MASEDMEIFEVIAGLVAFGALMMLFPICTRLGKILGNLRYLAADRADARAKAGDTSVWDAERNGFVPGPAAKETAAG